MKLIKTISFFAALLLSTQVSAQLSVNRSVIEFTPSEKVQDVEIYNPGNIKLYLDLKVAEIVNPESSNPTRVELGDARNAAVIVSPAQLLLQPGQRKRVRVIMRKPATNIDKVFRLAVKPYTGKLEIDNGGSGQKSSAIKVLVGYDLLLLSRPQQAQPSVNVSRQANTITFTNNGNTNVLLRRIEQCDGSQSNCVELQPNRLYAGEIYKVSLPKSGSASQYPVHVWQSFGLENSKYTY